MPAMSTKDVFASSAHPLAISWFEAMRGVLKGVPVRFANLPAKERSMMTLSPALERNNTSFRVRHPPATTENKVAAAGSVSRRISHTDQDNRGMSREIDYILSTAG